MVLVKPETVIAWHRKGFRLFWTWKVRRGQPGRPAGPKDIRELIRGMSREMVRRRKPPSQNWRTFLENQVKCLVSVDFGVTAHPTAEWTAQQLREEFPWETASRYLPRDLLGSALT